MENIFAGLSDPHNEADIDQYYKAAAGVVTLRQFKLIRVKWLKQDKKFSFQAAANLRYLKALRSHRRTVTSLVIGFVTHSGNDIKLYCPDVQELDGLKVSYENKVRVQSVEKLCSKYFVAVESFEKLFEDGKCNLLDVN